MVGRRDQHHGDYTGDTCHARQDRLRCVWRGAGEVEGEGLGWDTETTTIVLALAVLSVVGEVWMYGIEERLYNSLTVRSLRKPRDGEGGHGGGGVRGRGRLDLRDRGEVV